jgi:hypothetical protein
MLHSSGLDSARSSALNAKAIKSDPSSTFHMLHLKR